MTAIKTDGSGVHYAAVRRVLWGVLAANLTITAVKVTLGLITGALAVVADGFHSLVDSSSNLIGLAAIRLAGRPADERHPYGYRRYETLGALAIGGLLLAAAWEIGSAIVERFLGGDAPQVTMLTLGLVALTLPVNALIVLLESRAGKRLGSEILLADAKHTQTDLYITGSVIISLVVAWLGWPWLDLLVASGVVVLILRAAFSILQDTARWLTDARVADPQRVASISLGVPGVRYVHRIRSRGTPGAAFVDLHVKVAPEMSTSQAHAVASEVERRLLDELPSVTDALVHIEPARLGELSDWERMAVDMRQIADGMGLGLHDLHIHTDLDGDYTAELHLEFGGDTSLGEAHAVADQFERRVQARWPQVERVVTHLEPLPETVLKPEQQPDPGFESQVRRALAQDIGAENVLEVQTYLVGGHLGVAARVSLPAEYSLSEAHARCEQLETKLIGRFERLRRVTVHAEPTSEKEGL